MTYRQWAAVTIEYQGQAVRTVIQVHGPQTLWGVAEALDDAAFDCFLADALLASEKVKADAHCMARIAKAFTQAAVLEQQEGIRGAS